MKWMFAVATVAALFLCGDALACTTCNKPLQTAIFNAQFLSNLAMLVAPFPLIGLGIAAASNKAKLFHAATGAILPSRNSVATSTAGPTIAAATVIGVGMGAFVDGIVLHQILQWHQMLSNRLAPITLEAKDVNMFWDGLFSAFCWITTFAGILMLWRIHKRSDVVRNDRLLYGGFVLGWALFNIVEGLIDHQLLGLHNVRENDPNHDTGNFSFLGFSVLLLVAGWLTIRSGKAQAGLK